MSKWGDIRNNLTEETDNKVVVVIEARENFHSEFSETIAIIYGARSEDGTVHTRIEFLNQEAERDGFALDMVQDALNQVVEHYSTEGEEV